MKKIVGTILALAVLCSFMVVNVSAIEDSSTKWKTEYFEFYSDIELAESEPFEENGSIEYYYQLVSDSGDWIGEIQVFVYYADDYYEVYEEYIDEISEEYVLEEVEIGVRTGQKVDFSDEESLGMCIVSCVDEYLYVVGVDGLPEYESEYDTLCGIAEDIYLIGNANDDHAEDGFYEDPSDDMVSKYWETDYFYIDTDMELVMEDGSEYYEDENAENYMFWPAEVNGEYIEDDAGSIEFLVYHPDNIESEYQEYTDSLKDVYDEESEEGYLDICELKDIKINGVKAVQYTYAVYEGEFNGFERIIIASDNENLYMIQIECDSEYEELFYDLCDIVENDLHFNNAPAEDDKVEEKNEKTDKTEKEEKDDEEKDNSTVIIIVALVAGVVVLGIVAIVVLGKKKK